MFSQDCHSAASDIYNLVIDNTENDINIMNHQIQHNADINASSLERGQTVNFEISRIYHFFSYSKPCRVKTFDMSYL